MSSTKEKQMQKPATKDISANKVLHSQSQRGFFTVLLLKFFFLKEYKFVCLENKVLCFVIYDKNYYSLS